MQRQKYKWDLAEGIKSRLGESSYGRQRAMNAEGQLLLILHEPPGADDKHRKESVFLREKDGSWWHNGQRKGESMLSRLLEDYRKLLDEHEKRYDNADTADSLFKVMESLNPLLRSVKNMATALQSAREMVDGDKFVIQMRDESSDILRNYELLSDEMKLALDYRIAKNAESQINQAQKLAKAQHKLNIMAAITFPLMAMSSVFGMNLVSGLENAGGGLFWIVMSVGFIAGVIAVNWMHKN